MANAINNLTHEDIGMLWQLADREKASFVRLLHEHPNDKFYTNELEKLKRICHELWIAFTQNP